MTKYIKIDLRAGQPQVFDKTAGLSGESFVKGIEFILPDETSGWSVFVDIINPSGDKYRQEVLSQVNGTIKYEFSEYDLKERGRLFLDLVLVKEVNEVPYILKPFSGEFAVKKAVCANEEPTYEPVTIITAEITEDITRLMELYPVLSKLSDSDGTLGYNGEKYITEDAMQEALASNITVEGTTLVIGNN